ncbi:MAG: N-acetylmuramoyl-L-alanine amidase [Thermoleophilia bacterium]
MRILRPLILAVVALALATVPAPAQQALPYVAIDPGHGDKDTGAVGYLPPGTDTGMTPRSDAQGRVLIYEKDVNLDVALRLDGYLRGRGWRTLLTRTADLAGGDRPFTTTQADLKARVDAANAARVDLFVSIHNNALSATSSGTETYHFYYASAASRALAADVQAAMVQTLKLPDRKVQSAGFYVLRHTEMPAILTESAFLSNPSEALMLADPNIRQAIAEAIGRGLEAFAARPVTPPARLAPTIGPWKVKPRSVPPGYRLVKTGRSNPVGRGGWLAVVSTFKAVPGGLPATIGPWRVKPRSVPAGYRLVKTGPNNPVGRGGWLAVQKINP